MNNDELKHHGVLGMKWGVRRYQPYSQVPRGSGEGGKEIGDAAKKSKGNKYERAIARNEKQLNRVLNTRSKVEQRISNRYDKRIAREEYDQHSFDPILQTGSVTDKGVVLITPQEAKDMAKVFEDRANKLREQKKNKLEDYRIGTEAVKYGYDKYSDVIKKYANAKASALMDGEYKLTEEYKQAVRDYVAQIAMNVYFYGNTQDTKLQYSSQKARELIKDHPELYGNTKYYKFLTKYSK